MIFITILFLNNVSIKMLHVYLILFYYFAQEF